MIKKEKLTQSLYDSAQDEKPLSQVIDNLVKALHRCPPDLKLRALQNMNTMADKLSKQTKNLEIIDNKAIKKIAEFASNMFIYYNNFYLLNQNPKTAQSIFDYTMAIFRHRHDTDILMSAILQSKES